MKNNNNNYSNNKKVKNVNNRYGGAVKGTLLELNY